MFFLFILKEKGFPISEVFENEIKDIPTTRFSCHFDDEYKAMYYQIKKEKREKKKDKKRGGFGVDKDELKMNSPVSERVFIISSNNENKP